MERPDERRDAEYAEERKAFATNAARNFTRSAGSSSLCSSPPEHIPFAINLNTNNTRIVKAVFVGSLLLP